MIDIYMGGDKPIYKDTIEAVLTISNQDPTVESIICSLAYVPLVAPKSNVKIYAFINHKSGGYYPELLDIIIKDCHNRYGNLIAGYALSPSAMMIKNYGLQETIVKFTQLTNLTHLLKKESKIHIHPSLAEYDHEFESILELGNNNSAGLIIGTPRTPLMLTVDVLAEYQQKVSNRTTILNSSPLSAIRKRNDGYNYGVSVKNLTK